MRVSEVMTKHVECIAPDASLQDAADKMLRFDVGAIPVARNGKAIGIVTDRDIAVRAVACGCDPAETEVSEIMTRDPASCHEHDSLEEAAHVMERNRIRRLLVVDENERLRGILSLGDLALRTGDDELTEEVLEEVSWPGHLQRSGSRSIIPQRASRHTNSSSSLACNLMIGASALLAGAGLMYLFDPERGRRRQARLRDRLVHAAHQAQCGIGKTARYTRGRTRGLFAEAWNLLKPDHAGDAQIHERVRAALGRAVSNPHAISVEVRDGAVTLRGRVRADECDCVSHYISKVRGVRGVQSELEAHEPAEHEPDLVDSNAPPQRTRRIDDRWSPTTRLLGTAAGTGLIAWAVARRGACGACVGLAGAALAGRSLTNLPARRFFGVGAGRRAVDVQKDINIKAPLEKVFEFFSNYANFPHFMSRVREVRDHGNGRSHWIVRGPAGLNATWDADLTAFEVNRLLAWRSVPGSMVENAGIIRFEPNGHGGTRVDIKLSYNPPGGALGHAAAMIFGADPKSEMDQDLMRLKTAIETGHAAHDAAMPLRSPVFS